VDGVTDRRKLLTAREGDRGAARQHAGGVQVVVHLASPAVAPDAYAADAEACAGVPSTSDGVRGFEQISEQSEISRHEGVTHSWLADGQARAR